MSNIHGNETAYSILREIEKQDTPERVSCYRFEEQGPSEAG
jgi:hypothetical protein